MTTTQDMHRNLHNAQLRVLNWGGDKTGAIKAAVSTATGISAETLHTCVEPNGNLLSPATLNMIEFYQILVEDEIDAWWAERATYKAA